ncbi:MAG: DoxX family protein [Elusimicrobia bacterium]|nr:DoxX family protein [Elusimicrobiota bacterium]
MKRREAEGLAARLAVGAVLIYAGVSKVSAPAEEFAVVIQAYDVAPKDLAMPLAGLLPWVELFLGWSLLLGWRTRAAALGAGALFTAFLAALGLAALRGLALPNCGCFDNAVHFTVRQALGLDSLLALLCWAAFRSAPGPLSLDRWTERGTNGPNASRPLDPP